LLSSFLSEPKRGEKRPLHHFLYSQRINVSIQGCKRLGWKGKGSRKRAGKGRKAERRLSGGKSRKECRERGGGNEKTLEDIRS